MLLTTHQMARNGGSGSLTPLRPGTVAIVAAAGWLLSSPVQAATLRLGDLTFAEVSGDFRLTSGRRNSETSYTIQQDVFGPNVNLLMSIRGLNNLDYVGFLVESIVTNRTGTAWSFFDHELREQPDRRSPEEDGLSFAQGLNSVRPFTSDRLPRVDEVTDVRDFVNFAGGTVLPGQRVVFRYAITDNSAEPLFYLLQRPNYRPGTGFVTPAPVPRPSPSPSPVVRPSPSPSPVVVRPPVNPSPGNTAAVPEPTTILGGVLASLGCLWLRQRHSGDR